MKFQPQHNTLQLPITLYRVGPLYTFCLICHCPSCLLSCHPTEPCPQPWNSWGAPPALRRNATQHLCTLTLPCEHHHPENWGHSVSAAPTLCPQIKCYWRAGISDQSKRPNKSSMARQKPRSPGKHLLSTLSPCRRQRSTSAIMSAWTLELTLIFLSLKPTTL